MYKIICMKIKTHDRVYEKSLIILSNWLMSHTLKGESLPDMDSTLTLFFKRIVASKLLEWFLWLCLKIFCVPKNHFQKIRTANIMLVFSPFSIKAKGSPCTHAMRHPGNSPGLHSYYLTTRGHPSTRMLCQLRDTPARFTSTNRFSTSF